MCYKKKANAGYAANFGEKGTLTLPDSEMVIQLTEFSVAACLSGIAVRHQPHAPGGSGKFASRCEAGVIGLASASRCISRILVCSSYI
jgi:hypothetical protein